MEKKGSKPIVIMLVISAIILILGFMCGVGVYYQLTEQIATNNSGVFIDGTDVSGVLGMVGNAGALVISVLIVGVSLVAVLVQWLGYALVKLIKGIYNKNKQTPPQNQPYY